MAWFPLPCGPAAPWHSRVTVTSYTSALPKPSSEISSSPLYPLPIVGAKVVTTPRPLFFWAVIRMFWQPIGVTNCGSVNVRETGPAIVMLLGLARRTARKIEKVSLLYSRRPAHIDSGC